MNVGFFGEQNFGEKRHFKILLKNCYEKFKACSKVEKLFNE